MRAITALVMQLAVAVPSVTASQVEHPISPPRERVISAATAIMQTARYSTLVTLGEDGQLQARIVDPFAPEPDLTVWIGTNPLTRKVTEVRRDPRVTLLYFNAAADEYVTVHGIATLVSDSAERARHWKEEWAAFYNDGPGGDGYLLIRIRATRLEVVSPRHDLLNDPKTWRPVIVDLP